MIAPPIGAARAAAIARAGDTDGMVHVETITASSQSTVDFTDVFASDDGADSYVVVGDNIITENDQTPMACRFSTDGGSNWDSGSSDYAYAHFEVREDGGTGAIGNSGASEITEFVRDVGNDTANNDTSGLSLNVFDPTDSDRATVIRNADTMHINSVSTEHRVAMHGGIRLAQSAIDSIQFYEDGGGNISSGIFSVYAVTQ